MRRWVVGSALLAACSGGGPEGGGDGWDPGDREEPPTVVEVADVAPGAVSDVLVTSAVVESEAEADVVPAYPGTVLQVLREEGDLVRKGDVLAVIDNASLEATGERAKAEVERLEAEILRTRELHARGAISDRELDEAEYQLKAARTSAREASKSYGQTRLVAPFDGVVARRDVRVGEYVTGGRVAFRVVDPDRLRVVASLPERDLHRIGVDQTARLVSAYDPSRTAEARVVRVAPVVEAGTGTFRVTLELTGEHELRPGQFVSVEVEVDRHEGVVVVPKRALVYEDGAPIVYRMIPAPEEADDTDAEAVADGGTGGPSQGTAAWWPFGGTDAAHAGGETDAPAEAPVAKYVAERVPVQLGLVDTEDAEILGGLTLGDDVIVLGHTNLRDHAPVQTPAMHAEAREREEAKRALEEAKAKAAHGAGDPG